VSDIESRIASYITVFCVAGTSSSDLSFSDPRIRQGLQSLEPILRHEAVSCIIRMNVVTKIFAANVRLIHRANPVTETGMLGNHVRDCRVEGIDGCLVFRRQRAIDYLGDKYY
jgi:hypothetical protein